MFDDKLDDPLHVSLGGFNMFEDDPEELSNDIAMDSIDLFDSGDMEIVDEMASIEIDDEMECIELEEYDSSDAPFISDDDIDIELDFGASAPGLEIEGALEIEDFGTSNGDDDEFATPPPTQEDNLQIKRLKEGMKRPSSSWFGQRNTQAGYSSADQCKATMVAMPAIAPIGGMRSPYGEQPSTPFNRLGSVKPTLPSSPAIARNTSAEGTGDSFTPVAQAKPSFNQPFGLGQPKSTAAAIPAITSLANNKMARPTMVAMQPISPNFAPIGTSQAPSALQALKPLHRVPKLKLPAAEILKREDLDPRAEFIIGMINGITPLSVILKKSAWPEDQTAEIIKTLEEQGILGFR